MSLIKDNLGTIIVGLILILIILLIIKSMIKDKKTGKSLCTHDCSSCGMGGSCTKMKDLKNNFKKASKSL